MMAFITGKMVLMLVFFGEDIFRGSKYLVDTLFNQSPDATPVSVDSRRKFVTQIGIGLAALPFVSLIYGVIKGRYDFRVHKITLKSKDPLPQN